MHQNLNKSFLLSEPQKPDNDNEPVGGAGKSHNIHSSVPTVIYLKKTFNLSISSFERMNGWLVIYRVKSGIGTTASWVEVESIDKSDHSRPASAESTKCFSRLFHHPPPAIDSLARPSRRGVGLFILRSKDSTREQLLLRPRAHLPVTACACSCKLSWSLN